MLLLDFGVMSVDDLKSGRMTGASHPDLSYPLYDFLKSLVPLQAFAVLIIDEAQNLSSALLEEIRILSDLESPEKLLQVVLVGQLELRAKLKQPEMRQLDQRVSARCSLEALGREGVAGYISHRLGVAGGADDRVHFSPDAIDEIFRVAGGTPRVVNLICDRALYRGHLLRKSVIDLETVTQAIEDLGVGTLTPAPSFDVAPPITPVAPIAPVAPNAPTPTAPSAAPPAPTPPVAASTPLIRDSPSTDLSGLEVHDIDESVHAPAMASPPVETKRSIFGQKRPRRRLRWRVLRWAATATAVLAIVFVVLLGEAVFIHYFPALADQDLRLPASVSPRIPETHVAVPIPRDVTQPPPVPDLAVKPGVAPFPRE
jgi:hypothetical protein